MASLTNINYLNIAAVFIVGLHTLDIDLGPDFDFFDKFDMKEFPQKYEGGSMTPVSPMFFIFNVTALFLSMFGIVQLLPAYRSSPLVQEGVNYWFFSATIAQTFAYAASGNEEAGFLSTFFSTIFLGLMGVCVWKILDNQAKVSSNGSAEEFWLLRFPFSLHAAWAIALVVMSANMLFQGWEGNNDGGNNEEDGGFSLNIDFGAVMHFLVLVVSLAAYTVIPMKLLLFNETGPNYVIPAVLSLIMFGIAMNSSLNGNEGGDNNNDEDGNGGITWGSIGKIFYLIVLYLISLTVAGGTAFLMLKNEFNESAKDTEEPLTEAAYQGADMSSASDTQEKKSEGGTMV
mmetsp:Transcript_25352/g.31239  ORF Transcript_25352/g.31239 Transcript_25352/m.31239 type:complete len:344 (+) Transcript_25352:76-1107(+)